jgi:hypothetical protein
MSLREHQIIFRVTEQELEAIRGLKNEAQFATLSAFVRDRALCENEAAGQFGFPYERQETIVALNRTTTQLRNLMGSSNRPPEAFQNEEVLRMIENIGELLNKFSDH